jgi:Zn-dependent peptidase ImmA (M78 family)/DNA-binding XRE family transcriptional regulator
MARSLEALITPEVLAWARDSYGLDLATAAKRAGVSMEKLTAWENGEEKPSLAKARQLAKIYKRPLAVFYLPTPPKDFQTLRDFRKLADAENTPVMSPELKRAIRWAAEFRETALSLMEENGESFPELKISAKLSDSPEKLAVEIREKLGIDWNLQESWRDSYQALKAWKDAIEKFGILVTQVGKIPVKEMRAFSIGEFPLAVIAINSKDMPNGKIFSLLHELTHILLHQSGICQWDVTHKLYEEEMTIEVFCNHVAGAVLVPQDLLLQDNIVNMNKGRKVWDEEDLDLIARSFSVSREVVLRRLLTLGLTTDSFYEAKRQEFIEEYKKLAQKGGHAVVRFEKRIVNSLGKGFVQLALSSYYEKRISLNSLCDLLGVKTNYVPKIEFEVMK